MPYTQLRSCPICGKRNLKTIHTHLRNVHALGREERQPWLRMAKASSWLSEYGGHTPLKRQSQPNIDSRVQRDPLRTVDDLLQCDDKPGPLLVELNDRDWDRVEELFKDADSGGNLPPGWTLWRIYIVNQKSHFVPVFIKCPTSSKTQFYNVHEDWIIYAFPRFRSALTRKKPRV